MAWQRVRQAAPTVYQVHGMPRDTSRPVQLVDECATVDKARAAAEAADSARYSIVRITKSRVIDIYYRNT